jgi:flotillin
MSNTVVIIVGLLVLATLALSVLMGKMFRKAGPNEAIIVYGFRGPRVIKGGELSSSCCRKPRQLAGTDEFRRCPATGSLHEARRRRLSKPLPRSKSGPIRSPSSPPLSSSSPSHLTSEGHPPCDEGHLRGIIGQLTVEQIVKEPEMWPSACVPSVDDMRWVLR